VQKALAPAFTVRHVLDAFRHAWSRGRPWPRPHGLRGRHENPEGEAAEEAAFAHGLGEGLDGSSYVATQQWVHDLDAFEALGDAQRDHAIGRRLSDNVELEDSPESSHVKRTAQRASTPRPSCCAAPCPGC